MKKKRPDVPYLRLVEKIEEEEYIVPKIEKKKSIIKRVKNFLYWKDLKVSTILISLSSFVFLVLFISFIILTAFLS
tara:strand:- start:68 stop:295 length:228 start_codon:yes stop_codon:yes gene_type:complete